MVTGNVTGGATAALRDEPGVVIPILDDELDDFETEAGAYRAQQREEVEFMLYRLRQGVYGQRQPDVHMNRVKLADGRRDRRAAGRLRRDRGELRAAQEGAHHHPPEHADSFRATGPDARHAAGAGARRPVVTRGLREHGAQRHGGPLGGHPAGRGLRPDAVRGSVRALLGAQRDHPAAAAQVQGLLHRPQDRLRDRRDSRPGLLRRGPRDRRRRGARLPRDGRGRALDDGEGGAAAHRVRAGQRVPAALGSGDSDLQRGRRAAQEHPQGAAQVPRPPRRRGSVPGDGGGRAAEAVGRVQPAGRRAAL